MKRAAIAFLVAMFLTLIGIYATATQSPLNPDAVKRLADQLKVNGNDDFANILIGSSKTV
jgi:hypothetical protein